jgi:hypothetical protein
MDPSESGFYEVPFIWMRDMSIGEPHRDPAEGPAVMYFDPETGEHIRELDEYYVAGERVPPPPGLPGVKDLLPSPE